MKKFKRLISCCVPGILATTSLADLTAPTFTIPPGAVGVTYEVIDEDGWLNPDDVLSTGGHQDWDPAGNQYTPPLGLWCEDGYVQGAAGQSGERDPSISVRVIFTFASGATDTQTKKAGKATCANVPSSPPKGS